MTREESINYLKETAKKYEGRDVNCDFLTAALEVIEEILAKESKDMTREEEIKFTDERTKEIEALSRKLSESQAYYAADAMLEEKKKRDEKLS